MSPIIPSVTTLPVDTGYTAIAATGSKSAALTTYANGLNGTMVSALNVVSAGTGTALSTALDTIVILVQRLSALEATLAAGKLPNA